MKKLIYSLCIATGLASFTSCGKDEVKQTELRTFTVTLDIRPSRNDNANMAVEIDLKIFF